MDGLRVVLKRLDPALLKPPPKCDFCYRTENDELLYGKIHNFENINAHYYCLLFAGNLMQNGEDTEGILGFLSADIRAEIWRSQKETCSYCSKPGATVICVQRMCKKVFHLPCGMKNGSLHHFFRNFQSFCKNHRPYQKVPQYQLMLPEAPTCAICLEPVKRDIKSRSVVWAPCCKVNWLHHVCVQKLALHAGYFFKCPRCNNKKEFSKAMCACGIYIPEQDASWELEPNAFEELQHRHSECNAETCVCPMGREQDTDDTDWEVVLCESCGSQGIHLGCLEPARRNWPKWNCVVCLKAIKGPQTASSAPRCEVGAPPNADNVSPSCSGVNPQGSPRRLAQLKRPSELIDSSTEDSSSSSCSHPGNDVGDLQAVTTKRQRWLPGALSRVSRESVMEVESDSEEDVEVEVVDVEEDQKQPSKLLARDGTSIPIFILDASGVDNEVLQVTGDIQFKVESPETIDVSSDSDESPVMVLSDSCDLQYVDD